MADKSEARPRRVMPWGEIPRGEFPGDGLVVVDKPQGVTSHDIVGAMRRLAGTRKVGHAGTLDPMATGVLCVGVGRATKLLQYVTGTSKEYTATIVFGVGTDSDDATGSVTSSPGCSLFDAGDLRFAMLALTGEISQVPSHVSAKKVGGVRAYDLAREGVEFTLAANDVTIHEFAAVGEQRVGESNGTVTVELDVRVVCSAGTYIRSLARDLGENLGTVAHLSALRRTRVGSWGEAQAASIRLIADTIDTGNTVPIVPMPELCRGLFAGVEVNAMEAADLAMGRFIADREACEVPVGSSARSVAVAWADGVPIALVSRRKGQLKPDLLLAV